MNIRPEFQQFIGSSSWGKQKDMYDPTTEELQANSFQLPVDEKMDGTFHRTHLDFLNIGHNAKGFNALDPATRSFAQEVAERRGTYAEIRALGKQGETAAIHMSNVVDAQNSLTATLLGPTGFPFMMAMEALAPHVPNAEGRQLSLAVGVGGPDMIAADVYPLSSVQYMGSELKGVTEEPIGRVYIDMTNGTAFMLPDDKFHGRS